MKVQGGSGTSATSAPSRTQGQAAPGFSPITESEDVRESAPTGRAGGLSGINSLDALLALQEAPGPMERRKRAVKRAGKLLDLLDSVKISLLEGDSGNAVLSQLTHAVRESRAGTDDPMLEGVLDEIETRAAVELAKQEVARDMDSRAA